MMQLHLNPQKKGGIGKSFVASILAQHFLAAGKAPICIDTDPQNQTFQKMAGLGTTWINILDEDERFNEGAFDGLMQRIFTGKEDDIFVVDCGTSTFVPLCSYINDCGALGMLAERGVAVFLHSVIAGGDLHKETVNGGLSVMDSFPTLKTVLWLNEFSGRIEKEHGDFEETSFFETFDSRIFSLVRLKKRSEATFGVDIRRMMTHSLTFAEAIKDERFEIMAKQRLKMVWRDLDSQLHSIAFEEGMESGD